MQQHKFLDYIFCMFVVHIYKDNWKDMVYGTS